VTPVKRSLGAILLAPVFAACPAGPPPPDAELLASLAMPAEHETGRALFERHCTPCHGPYALGTEQGPPLVHRVYRPLHHGDEAFQLAVAQGVRAHHWRFGDMAAVPGLDRDDVAAITGYVRWLQRSAGIE
jgi:mono/diheme cytochrome c family protein